MMAQENDDAPSPAHVMPNPTPYHAPRFSLDTAQGVSDAMEFLEREGYAVIADVISPAARAQAMSLLWDWLEGMNENLKRDDWQTWSDAEWPGSLTHAVIASHGIGHSDFLWFLRTQLNVRRVFEAIWGDSNLLSSFDGCGIFRPYTERPEWRTTGGWYHVDQGPTKPGKQCVQGLVSLTPATSATGGLVVIPRSHHLHDRLMSEMRSRGDFVKIRPDNDYVPFDQAIIVCCNAGDMLVWDSRTIHCSTPAVAPEPHSMEGLLRVVAYICMTPRHRAPDHVLRTRVQAYECFTTTNHWPHEYKRSARPQHERPARKISDANIAIQELVSGFRRGSALTAGGEGSDAAIAEAG